MKISKTQWQNIKGELKELAAFNTGITQLLADAEGYASDIIPNDLLRKIYRTLCTARNKNLITSEEQKKLQDTVVCFFGLSVGSHAALTWLMQSRPNCIKISDPDIVSATNLNRLRYPVSSIGKTKTGILKKKLQEIDPYVEIISSNKKNDFKQIIEQKVQAHIIVDAVDDLSAKIKVRQIAREKKIPVLMATDVGDNVILDIERYDSGTVPEIFLGRVKDLKKINLENLHPLKRLQIIFKLVGFKYNSEAMLSSITQIGAKIPTWPQLGATATIAGGVITTAIKKIVLGENIKSGRYFISLDDILCSDFNSKENTARRKDLINTIENKVNSV